jgi:hypothetical protein
VEHPHAIADARSSLTSVQQAVCVGRITNFNLEKACAAGASFLLLLCGHAHMVDLQTETKGNARQRVIAI